MYIKEVLLANASNLKLIYSLSDHGQLSEGRMKEYKRKAVTDFAFSRI